MDVRPTKTIHKYLERRITGEHKYIVYKELLKAVLIDNILIADEAEIKMCYKILPVIQKIGENIMTEMKELRKFAKEVGISPIESGKIKNEKELTKLIIRSIDQSKDYTQEFVEWYDSVDEEEMNAADAIDESNDESNDESGLGELIDLIKETSKKEDLLEIANDEDYEEIFGNIKKVGLAPKIKKAMLEAIEDYKNNMSEDEDEDTEEIEVTEENLEEVINGLETDEDVEAFMSTEIGEELFKEIEFDDEDIDTLKAMLLEAAGIEVKKPKANAKVKKEKKEKKEKKTNKKAKADFEFDPDNIDVGECMEHFNNLKYVHQKSFAKEIGLKVPLGTKADELANMVQEHLHSLAGVEESTEATEDIEITPDMVEEALAEEDTETLIEIAEHLNIKLTALTKRSAKKMADTILEVIGNGDTDDSTDEEEKSDAPITVYATIEQMFLNGTREVNDIYPVIKDMYKELGVSPLKAKKRVEAIIQLMSEDYK